MGRVLKKIPGIKNLTLFRKFCSERNPQLLRHTLILWRKSVLERLRSAPFSGRFNVPIPTLSWQSSTSVLVRPGTCFTWRALTTRISKPLLQNFVKADPALFPRSGLISCSEILRLHDELLGCEVRIELTKSFQRLVNSRTAFVPIERFNQRGTNGIQNAWVFLSHEWRYVD